jgi:histidine ammonia-lyase
MLTSLDKVVLGDLDQPLSAATLAMVARGQPGTPPIQITTQAADRVSHAAAIVADIVARREVVYGISTGFGAFKDRVIAPDALEQLQANLIMSQTVGVGPAMSREETRALMLARAQTLALGYSGLRLPTLQLLADMLNAGVHPLIPLQGSVGASGDLAPLSHMALGMMGEGDAEIGGRTLPAHAALAEAGLAPVRLQPKERLALCNGTSQIAGLLGLAVADAANLVEVADITGAMSFEALAGVPAALDPRIHAARRHAGQQAAAAHLRALIAGSDLIWPTGGPPPPFPYAGPTDSAGPKVQDAYALRCMAQVHGPAREVLAYVQGVVENELNAGVDNPLVFGAGPVGADEEAAVLSGGNFHGAPVAVAADVLGIPIAGLASISERRQARLVDVHAHGGLLPPFLIEDGGLNTGFMITQYTAAALVSENKSLAHPASVDSIPTSANQEDHVSMGPIAARHARAIVANTATVLALEWLTAAQAIDCRLRRAGRPLRLGRGTAAAYALLRTAVPYLERDTIFTPHIAAATDLLTSGRLAATVAAALRAGG